jgi:hypothetical protein
MSNSPARLDLNGKKYQAAPIRCGDDFIHPITFEYSDGQPINKSAVTWLCQLRPFASSDIIVATFDITVTGADSNIVSIILTDTVTALLEPGNYVWDLQEIDGSTTITRVAGVAVVEPDVSRS